MVVGGGLLDTESHCALLFFRLLFFVNVCRSPTVPSLFYESGDPGNLLRDDEIVEFWFHSNGVSIFTDISVSECTIDRNYLLSSRICNRKTFP
uniref:Uncharacterized protein n=1 Tax=Candidatus Kentrum sp. FW TaxID=2126338 RepID=A0A450TSY9_9GAMM|nr:MAG: hypothetical protein BECKFW1821C_GA0114237_102836 [Candidatus Kentron sp. FW]